MMMMKIISCQSVSDDSVDLGGSEKHKSHTKGSQKSVQKPTVSWWQDDEHSGGGTGRGNNEDMLDFCTTS